MAAVLPPKSPMLLALLAAGGLWLFLRQRAAAAATGARTLPVRSTGQVYAYPGGVAEQLGQFVVGMTKGFLPGPPKVAEANPDAARAAVRAGDAYYQAVQDANPDAARAAVRDGDAYYGSAWVAPAQDLVRPQLADAAGPDVDSTLRAPVYDVSVDLIRNPWQWGTFG